MTVPSLRVPREHVDPFKALRDAETSDFDQLLEALNGEDLTLSRSELLDRLHNRVPHFDAEIEDIVDALLSLQLSASRHGWSAPDVGEAIASSPDISSTDNKARFADRIARALSSSHIRAVAKSLGIISSYERVYHRSHS